MRPDFKCGVCHELVPEFYYGGSCRVCQRIRCNNCMRDCPVCHAALCPDCLGEQGTGTTCMHAPLQPPDLLSEGRQVHPALARTAMAGTMRPAPASKAARRRPGPGQD